MNLNGRTIVTILLLLVITGRYAFAQSANGIAGKWESEWGLLIFQHSAIAGNQSVSITGSWNQGNGKIGEIRNGTFDPSRGVLEFSYYQPWNNTTGIAKFTLSSDGQKLSGTWSQSDGQSGTWNCKRTADNTSSEKIIRVTTCFTFKGGNYIESEKHDYNSGQTKYVIIAWDILSPASMGGSNTYLGNNLYLLTSHADEEYQGKGIKNYYKDFKSGMFADRGKFAIRFNDTGSNPLNITKYSSFIVIITLQEYDEFVKVNGERGILNLSL